MLAVVKIGDNLRRWRTRRALTQEQLAERARVGKNTVARIERDEVDPHMTTVRKLADTLQVDPGELVGDA